MKIMVGIPTGCGSPFDIEEVVAVYPEHIHSRIANQSGVFTIQPKPWQALNLYGIQKWVIDKKAIPHIRTWLRRFRVDRVSLFPGLDTLASQITDDIFEDAIFTAEPSVNERI
jgi:hypothetical protein